MGVVVLGSLTGIAESDGRGDLAGDGGGKLLGSVVDEHGSLGVSGEDDLGVGTLGERLLNKTRPKRSLVHPHLYPFKFLVLTSSWTQQDHPGR